MTGDAIGHLFVYGTLRPGDVRWHLLAPFVVDEGWPDTVSGELFDTGFDYPAASFNGRGTIHGRSFALLEASRSQALDVLDHVEGVVEGEYSRVAVCTGRGIDAWAYAGGEYLDLTPIDSGDWFEHRPPRST
jgi:gamma-glutamylcyclotransferase (GGCT)/AIG2-like uncharacterized protein YtfP